MTDHDDVAQRAYHTPDPDRIQVRDVDDPEDGLMTIRMPISSTAEARDGKAFDRSRLEGWADQIREGTVGAFLDHGRNMDVSGSRYSSTGKVGYLADPELVERDDGETDLVVDNVLMDPETLPSATGGLREALARIKSQVEREIPLTASVGWSDDTGDRDVPGGSDLLENSLVGIPSDPSASSHDAAVEMARTAMAADGDRDPEKLVADFRAVVMGPDEQTRHLSEQQADLALRTLDEFVSEQGDASVDNFEEWIRMRWGTLDEDVMHATRTALKEFHRATTPLEEPVSEQLRGFLDERADADGDSSTDDSMSDDTNDSGDEPDDTHDDDGSDGISAGEFREQMLEMQRNQTETLNTMAEVVREDDDDDDDGDDDGDDNGDSGGDDDDDDDDDDDRTVTIDGEEMTASEAVETLRDDVDDAEPEAPGDDDDGRDDEPADERTSDPKELL